MLIGVAKETWPGEVRSALVPANATKLIKGGFSIAMESGAGGAAGFTDEQFTEAGGEQFAALSCLNTSPAGLTMLEHLLRRELSGWIRS